MVRLFFLISLSFLLACNSKRNNETKNIEPSFYFWKSVFKLSAKEQSTLQNLGVKTLYIKFFDVVWDEKSKQALPVAQINVRDTFYLKNNINTIIPTVFITNESLLKLDSVQTKAVAKNILTLTKEIASKNNLKTISEIQIDCDWTAKTRNKYFSILLDLQKLDTTINFSTTIRLHQIKYAQNTGVPPVKNGMLMCYNMGNLTNINTTNSIIEIKELKKYTGDLKYYPLQLDVALPLFAWKVHFRKNTFKGLIQDLDENQLNNSFCKKDNNKFTITKDTMVYGYNFKKEDVIRVEESQYKEIIKAKIILFNEIKNKNLRVSLYHLDTVTLNKFSKYEMENIFNNLY